MEELLKSANIIRYFYINFVRLSKPRKEISTFWCRNCLGGVKRTTKPETQRLLRCGAWSKRCQLTILKHSWSIKLKWLSWPESVLNPSCLGKTILIKGIIHLFSNTLPDISFHCFHDNNKNYYRNYVHSRSEYTHTNLFLFTVFNFF